MTNDSSSTAHRAIALLDLTELGDHATVDDVTALCTRAIGPHGKVAAVCVWPRHVAHAARQLAATGVRIATVVNFPSGNDDIDAVVELARAAQLDGADEIDLVLPYRAFLAGDHARGAAMISAVRQAVAAGSGKTLKVILETGELVDLAVIRAAAELAIRHGADFIKTSTGKTPVSATLGATQVMLQVIHDLDPAVGLKPSGGIRTLADAAAHLAQADTIMGPAWASPATFRFGASGLLTALEAAIDGDTTVTGKAAY
ncbi:MAG: deoxyribose-phosphate aldolase [Ilumatobacteraceae bacterium]|nr:deoxyribose-phosphate aldolase [Acidimicrobiaceae bacterium]MBP6487021.1 deoxyribose-phosphate aldolase [Ilumatobacteraceae bacterium]MBP7890652.1 deoxyribose-phosphate aldolase [Ilumatobacteraceae bacterium]MBP8210483.1 deoxyribose-phosphate aldolase [Ilumatobacteraceae bacterium]MBP9053724.1 deoxyribose-phosphate aldolase [Ilumatobacteraceae bacterium]